MPKISVIVPVYNVENYLRACIDSILNQTFTDFEIILVDDGSPDDSGRICDEYSSNESRIYTIHKKNGGLASARNAGIDAALGEYITFVDSDDFVDIDYLMNYYNAFNNYDVDIVHTGLRYLPSGKELKEGFPVNKVLSGIEMIEATPELSKNIAIPFSVRYCFKRNFLNNNNLRFNENIKYAEDTPFNIVAISKAKSMICVDSISYNYVSRINSITSNPYKPTMVEDSNYIYLQKKMLSGLLKKNRFKFEKDMNEKHINSWLPSCIENYKNSPDGFTIKKAKFLLSVDFVQDGARFFLENKFYNRKLQYLYYRAIVNNSIFVCYFWKYGDIRMVIG